AIVITRKDTGGQDLHDPKPRCNWSTLAVRASFPHWLFRDLEPGPRGEAPLPELQGGLRGASHSSCVLVAFVTMWESLVCEAPMPFVRHLVEWHGESYAVEPSAEAQAGASLRVR